MTDSPRHAIACTPPNACSQVVIGHLAVDNIIQQLTGLNEDPWRKLAGVRDL